MIQQAAARLAPADTLRIDKQECLYDASAGFTNSLDIVTADVSTGQAVTSKSLYVNLTTLNTLSKPFLDFDLKRSSEDPIPTAYLEIRQTRSFKPSKQIAKEAEKIRAEQKAAATSGDALLPTIPRLYDLKTSYVIHVKPGDFQITLPETQDNWTEDHVKSVPEVMLKLCRDVAATETLPPGVSLAGAFEDPAAVIVDKLAVAPNPQQVSCNPGEWKCQECGRRKNLWLNLSDGFMGCGRRQYGVPESGCAGDKEGAALRHYAAHPDFHLAVKLGTISSVSADVYSYMQDAPVIDKDLDLHLKRLGLDRAKLSQTERATQDLAFERNQALNFGLSLEDEETHAVTGTGKTGIVNIGNSCYIASLIQALARVLNAQECWWKSPSHMSWVQACISFLTTTGLLKSHLQNSLAFQLIRLVFPLVNDVPCLVPEWQKAHKARHDYLKTELGEEDAKLFPSDDATLKPGTPSPAGLKRLIGTHNKEFATSFQQDAEEFYQVLFNALMVEERKYCTNGKVGLCDMLRVLVELKEVVNAEKKTVRLLSTDVPLLSLPMPADKQGLSLIDLIKHWQHDGCRKGVTRFPPFLMIQVRRMTVDEKYNAVKITTPLEIPEELNLDFIRSKGLAEGEKLDVPEFPAETRSTLEAFGFNQAQIGAAARALGLNEPIERITEWLLTHGSDVSKSATPEYDPSSLLELGFDRESALKALRAFKGDVTQAANALLTGEPIPEENCSENCSVGVAEVASSCSGGANYRLCAVIVHLGSNAFSGHYVTYLREEGCWYLFNDDRVSSVTKLDLRCGYLYLYLQI